MDRAWRVLARKRREQLEKLGAGEVKVDMKPNSKISRLNWAIAIVAVTLAAVAAQSPLF